MMAAPEAAVAVGRDKRDRLNAWPGDDLGDDVARDGGEITQTALLPRGDEQTDTRVVGDGGTRGAERDPAARALATAPDRPRDRRAAARADGRGEPRQRGRAQRTERGARKSADDTSLGKQEVEQHMEPRYAPSTHASVPSS